MEYNVFSSPTDRESGATAWPTPLKPPAATDWTGRGRSAAYLRKCFLRADSSPPFVGRIPTHPCALGRTRYPQRIERHHTIPLARDT